MKISELPMFWINTFLKPGKKIKMPDAKLGVASALLASLIIGIISLLINAVSAGAVTTDDFLFNVIGIPVAVLVSLFVFSILVRGISSLFGGKGTLNKVLGVSGLFCGSLTFVGGLFFVIFGTILNQYINYLFSLSFSFALLMGYTGFLVGVGALLFFIVYAAWSKWLAEIEDIEPVKMGLVLGLSIGILILGGAIIYGIYTDMTIAPYLEELLQLQDLGGLGLGG